MKNPVRGNPVNLVMLRHYVTNGPIKKSWLCNALGITYPTLKRKLEGKNEITLWEAKKMSETLGMTREERNAIFFGDIV